jgi:hypothetical protein
VSAVRHQFSNNKPKFLIVDKVALRCAEIFQLAVVDDVVREPREVGVSRQGESGGYPRETENPAERMEDIRCARLPNDPPDRG